MLTSFLLGKSRAAILASLFCRADSALHLQELARVSHVSPGTVRSEQQQAR